MTDSQKKLKSRHHELLGTNANQERIATKLRMDISYTNFLAHSTVRPVQHIFSIHTYLLYLPLPSMIDSFLMAKLFFPRPTCFSRSYLFLFSFLDEIKTHSQVSTGKFFSFSFYPTKHDVARSAHTQHQHCLVGF